MSASTAVPAAGRAAAYLVACGLPPATAAECAALFLAHLRAANIATDPTAEIVATVEDWARILPAESPPDLTGPGLARSRARMLLVGLPACRPGRGPASLPPGLREMFARVNLQAVPDLHQTAMTPQPLDLGPLSEVADGTWRTFDKWPVLRGVAMWTLFLLLLAAALFMVRY